MAHHSIEETTIGAAGSMAGAAIGAGIGVLGGPHAGIAGGIVGAGLGKVLGDALENTLEKARKYVITESVLYVALWARLAGTCISLGLRFGIRPERVPRRLRRMPCTGRPSALCQ